MDNFVPRKCKPGQVKCLAKNLVDGVLWNADSLIKKDKAGYFLYKRPFLEDDSSYDSDDADFVKWMTIEQFTLNDGMSQIREFISGWELSPATKFALEPRSEKVIPGRGKHVFVDAIFSKPTYRCPNPLAVAMVHFAMHVSSLLPTYYPIMVTYRFEGFQSTFYALGERCIRSSSFQRYYIDTVLHMKLSFYAKICECMHPEMVDRIPDKDSVEETDESKSMASDTTFCSLCDKDKEREDTLTK